MLQLISVTILAFVLLGTQAGNAQPSFDCTKAQTASEKWICELLELQWLDRQAAKLYEAAKMRQTGEARDSLIQSQRDFLARRESCIAGVPQGFTTPPKAGSQTPRTCLERAHIARLYELGGLTGIYEAFAEYVSPKGYSGALWVARYEFTASISLSTARDLNAHECGLEFDGAPKGGKGVIRWHGPADDYYEGCRVNLIPEGDDVRIESKGCDMTCGHNAWIDGLYQKKR